MARYRSIRFLAFVFVAFVCGLVQSQAQSEANGNIGVQKPTGELFLGCGDIRASSDQINEMICSQLQLVPKKTAGLRLTTEQLLRPTTDQLKSVSGSVATSSWSVYVARNLADEDNTKIFLKGVVGKDMAETFAPSVFRALSSTRTLYATVAVGVVAGALYFI